MLCTWYVLDVVKMIQSYCNALQAGEVVVWQIFFTSLLNLSIINE